MSRHAEAAPGSGAEGATAPPPEPTDSVHTAAYRGAVTGGDAYHGIMLAVRTEGGLLRIGNRFVPLERFREIAFVAFGTAAVSQALALNDVLADRLTQGFLAGPMPPPRQLPFRSVVLPIDLPGAAGTEEARSSALELASELPARSLLLVLLSPGALGVLSAPPPGIDVPGWRQWLADLHRGGASGAEVSRVTRVLGGGLVGGALARAARDAEVVTLLVERGDGASVGGGPTRAVTDEERREVAALLDRVPPSGSLGAMLRSRLSPETTGSSSLPPTVGRPVVTAGPADALSGAAGAVGERRWMPRLAGLFLPGSPEVVARTFVTRIAAMAEQYRAAAREAKRNGLVVFASTTFALPEGVDERPVMSRWLSSVVREVRLPGTTVGVMRTAGADQGAPPGLVADLSGKAVGLPMQFGVTDVGLLLVARIPLSGTPT